MDGFDVEGDTEGGNKWKQFDVTTPTTTAAQQLGFKNVAGSQFP
jgi:hypothetical protein